MAEKQKLSNDLRKMKGRLSMPNEIFGIKYDKICDGVEALESRIARAQEEVDGFLSNTPKDWGWYFYEYLGYTITEDDEQNEALKKAMDDTFTKIKAALGGVG